MERPDIPADSLVSDLLKKFIVKRQRMHEMRITAIDGPVALAAVSQSASLSVTVFTHSPDGATLMRPLLHYCSHVTLRDVSTFHS